MSDLVIIKVKVSTGFAGCQAKTLVEIPREDWDSLDDRERNECLMEEMFSLIEWSWEEI